MSKKVDFRTLAFRLRCRIHRNQHEIRLVLCGNSDYGFDEHSHLASEVLQANL